jgi:hypothetical protein
MQLMSRLREERMAFKFKDIVPWGRTFDEYQRMFDLNENDLKLKILGCGDGPASFNYELNQQGGNIVSIDPIYNLTWQEIKTRIDETFKDILVQAEANKDKFRWDVIASVEALGEIRMQAMKLFLTSYDEGKTNKKYIPATLPELPFADDEFDIALSSHFLFLYTHNLSYEFHVDAINEMLRVANEVRIFPLLDVNAKKSFYVSKIVADFDKYDIEIQKVNYEFQIGGNEQLIIKKSGK